MLFISSLYDVQIVGLRLDTSLLMQPFIVKVPGESLMFDHSIASLAGSIYVSLTRGILIKLAESCTTTILLLKSVVVKTQD